MLKTQKGLSLIEILIALLVSSIVTAAVITLLSNSLDTSRQLTETAKLDASLNNAIESIAHDIQRAGYYADATSSQSNPFFTGNDDITINGQSNCITFAYQTDTTNTPTVGVNLFGYRLYPNNAPKAIQYRTTAGGNNPCSSQTGWENLTDPNIINISNFAVTINSVDIDPTTGNTTTNTPYTSYRSVTVIIAGNLINDTNTSRTISRTIKVYNNKYTP